MIAPPIAKDDRLLAPTKWTSTAVVPVLAAAFAILYVFPGDSMTLWGWMVCPKMAALIMGGGYLAGAFFFTRVVRSREWHRVAPGFVATTVFSAILLATTVLQWDVFNHDHVSFWAWLALYVVTPPLLPLLWVKNRRTDPGGMAPGDVAVPRALRTVVGVGGALQLAVAAVMLGWPEQVIDVWPFEIEVTEVRAVSAFVAFPAVTWFWFLFEKRWSCFRITQQTAILGVVLIALGAPRASADFRSDGWFAGYCIALLVSLALNVALYVAMERRARRGASAVASTLSGGHDEPALILTTV